MIKLRNIGYLRFGSKIRQGFAGGITSLSPLWISWAENEGAEGKGGVLYLWQGACRPAGGRQAPSKDLCAKKNYIYLHVGPCRPLHGGRGIKL